VTTNVKAWLNIVVCDCVADCFPGRFTCVWLDLRRCVLLWIFHCSVF